MRLLLPALIGLVVGFLLGRLLPAHAAPSAPPVFDSDGADGADLSQAQDVVPVVAAESEGPTDSFMPEADPQAQIRIHGRLLDGQFQPQAQTELRGALVSPKGRVGAFCRSDALGHFVWLHRGAVPPDVTHFEIWPQNFPRGRLEIWPTPLERARIELKAPLPRGDVGVGDLVLGAEAVLAAGTVRDPEGRPLAGVRVRVQATPSLFPSGAYPAALDSLPAGWTIEPSSSFEVEAETDASGRFVLRHAAQVRSLSLELSREDFLPLGPRKVTPKEAGALEFTLARAK